MKMFDELLIEEVRKHSVIYDLTHPKYMDAAYKINIWRQIGEKLKLDGRLCKTRWNNMRDNYRKSLAKTKYKKVKSYKYSQELSFLKDYFSERKTRRITIGPSEEGDKQDYKADNAVKEENTVVHPLFVSVEDESNTLEHDASTINEKLEIEPVASSSTLMRPLFVSVGEESNKSERNAITRNEKLENESVASSSHNSTDEDVLEPVRKKIALKRQGQTQAPSAKLIKCLIKSIKDTRTTQHPVDEFLASIASTLKSLSPYHLHFAKSEIFAIAQKYELKMLTEQ